MIITILGWLALIIIVIITGLYIFSFVSDYYNEWIMKIRYQGVKDLVQRINGSKYWLNSEERAPFQKFYEHIVSDIDRTGNVNPERLRSKVDEILKQQNIEGEKIRQTKSIR